MFSDYPIAQSKTSLSFGEGRGETVKRYIPQREPMIMVDQLLEADDSGGKTSLVVGRGNYFLDRDERLLEFGLIEHMAQSASAVAGWRTINAGGDKAPVGFIAEVKHFNCYHLPTLGDALVTTIEFGIEVAGITMVKCVTRKGDDVVADAQMKIFIQ